MARAGRKRKQVAREPNGRPQRPTQAVLNEINEREAKRVKTVVLNQPHRKGAKDPEDRNLEMSCALERFCGRVSNGETLLSAGLEYEGIARRWGGAWGTNRGPAPDGATGTGEGPSLATAAAWARVLDELDDAMTRASNQVRLTTQRLVMEKIDPMTRQEGLDARLGLTIIARELGLLKPDHPFR